MELEHLMLNLESPLMAFGGPVTDQLGPTAAFPTASLLTGLLGNALGWRRAADQERLQTLQDRLVFAARIDRAPHQQPLTDLQVARLSRQDAAWTWSGRPQVRAGGASTLESSHLRFRDYHADRQVTVALRLAPGGRQQPDLNTVAQALVKPARPLFIGHKPCLPSAPIYAGRQTAPSALEALLQWPWSPDHPGFPQTVALQWPETDTPQGWKEGPEFPELAADLREWRHGRHAGRSPVCRLQLPGQRFPQPNRPQPGGSPNAARSPDPEALAQ